MADQLQTARRHTNNSRECCCSFTTLINQLLTLNLLRSPIATPHLALPHKPANGRVIVCRDSPRFPDRNNPSTLGHTGCSNGPKKTNNSVTRLACRNATNVLRVHRGIRTHRAPTADRKIKEVECQRSDSQELPRNARLLRDANVLWFSEKTQRFFAAFAADAALFHSAERDAEIAHQPAIYPDRAGVDLLGDAMCTAQVLRPDAR